MTREVEPAILQRLGLVVIRWSLIESQAAELLFLLVKIDPAYGYVITSNVSQKSVTEWIRTLIQMLPISEELETMIEEAMVEMNEMRGERNTYIHGLWGTEGPDNSAIVQTVKPERTAIVENIVVTAADLDDFIDRTLSLFRRFTTILPILENM
jgi:hypothetical protein